MSIGRKVLIIDGHHMMHRCANIANLVNLRTRKGVRTGVLYGVLNSIRKAVDYTLRPYSSIYFVCDSGVAEWRRQILPGYKDRREFDKNNQLVVKKIDHNISYSEFFNESKKVVVEFLQLLGIHVIDGLGEADDVIYNICKIIQEESADNIVTVVSDDNDFNQLIHQFNGKVEVYKQIKDIFLSENNFLDFNVVQPGWFMFLKNCQGDSSDKIPKATPKGCGELGVVSAIQLLTLEGMPSGDVPEALDLFIDKCHNAHSMYDAEFGRTKNSIRKCWDQREEFSKAFRRNEMLMDFTKAPDMSEVVKKIMYEPVQFNSNEISMKLREFELYSMSDLLYKKEFNNLS